MRVLALDTTTASGSMAIVEDDRVLAEERGDATRPHAERLPGDLLRLLDSVHLALGDMDRLAIARGPGSFTGLRIGIATIQGLAAVTGKPVVPISALEALAHAASGGVAPAGLVGIWMDGHRGDVFNALYRVHEAPLFSAARLEEVDDPSVDDPSLAWARWRDRCGVPDVMAGDGAVVYASQIGARSRLVGAPLMAGALGLLAAGASDDRTVDAGGVQPLYLRRPDAEVARDLQRARSHPAGREGGAA